MIFGRSSVRRRQSLLPVVVQAFRACSEISLGLPAAKFHALGCPQDMITVKKLGLPDGRPEGLHYDSPGRHEACTTAVPSGMRPASRAIFSQRSSGLACPGDLEGAAGFRGQRLTRAGLREIRFR